jgi:hypothetical protein
VSGLVLRLTQAVKLAVLIGMTASVVVAGVGIRNLVTPDRSPESFCRVCRQKERQYLEKTGRDNLDAGMLAILGILQMFDGLFKVAPDEIRSDVELIRDRVRASGGASGGALDNPLGALGSAPASGFLAAPAWDRVGRYVEQNCERR